MTATAIPERQDDGGPAMLLSLDDLPLPALEYEDGESPFVREANIRTSDTIQSALIRLGVRDPDSQRRFSSDPSLRRFTQRLRPNAKILVTTSRRGRLLALSAADASAGKIISVTRQSGALIADDRALPISYRNAIGSGTIRTSFFAAADAAGLPETIATALQEVFGGSIDFRRDLKRGDQFSVIYEQLCYQGELIRNGRIIAARLVVSGKEHTAFWFSGKSGQEGYFATDGNSLRQDFLRTPVAYTRIASGFVSREHPVLKKWILHKGIDFSAPIGTPVLASADGVLDFVGDMRGFGNFIVIKHGSRISTAYGHLNEFAAGLAKGQSVRQGQVIGYVGQTGWATGPHLHYEFRVNGQHTDPMAVNLPSSRTLTGVALAGFRLQTDTLRSLLSAGASNQLALRD